MVRCEDCQWIGDDADLKVVRSGLGDDPWGAGESFITEWLCPECGSDDFEDGNLCSLCDGFVLEGQHCVCMEE